MQVSLIVLTAILIADYTPIVPVPARAPVESMTPEELARELRTLRTDIARLENKYESCAQLPPYLCSPIRGGYTGSFSADYWLDQDPDARWFIFEESPLIWPARGFLPESNPYSEQFLRRYDFTGVDRPLPPRQHGEFAESEPRLYLNLEEGDSDFDYRWGRWLIARVAEADWQEYLHECAYWPLHAFELRMKHHENLLKNQANENALNWDWRKHLGEHALDEYPPADSIHDSSPAPLARAIEQMTAMELADEVKRLRDQFDELERRHLTVARLPEELRVRRGDIVVSFKEAFWLEYECTQPWFPGLPAADPKLFSPRGHYRFQYWSGWVHRSDIVSQWDRWEAEVAPWPFAPPIAAKEKLNRPESYNPRFYQMARNDDNSGPWYWNTHIEEEEWQDWLCECTYWPLRSSTREAAGISLR